MIALAFILLAGSETAFCAEQFGQRKASSNIHMQEWSAYYHPAGDEKNFKDAKSKYLLKLSPGGRIFFLANRKDFAEALSELKRFDRQDTGSALYVKAICLDGLKKHNEAVQCFAAAQSKIDFVFHSGSKFYLQYATALMHALDFVDYLHDPVAPEKKQGNIAIAVPAVDETLLLQARQQMSARAYRDCYDTLDRFIDANVAEGFAPSQLYMRGDRFINNYLHKVRMLQLGAGFASDRQNMALSLRGNLNPGQSDFWNCVEDRLLGRQKLNSPKDSHQVKKNPQFVPWCHYAIGLRALSKKNYKTAAAEFGAVKPAVRFDSDLLVYSSVLKAFCEKHP